MTLKPLRGKHVRINNNTIKWKHLCFCSWRCLCARRACRYPSCCCVLLLSLLLELHPPPLSSVVASKRKRFAGWVASYLNSPERQTTSDGNGYSCCPPPCVVAMLAHVLAQTCGVACRTRNSICLRGSDACTRKYVSLLLGRCARTRFWCDMPYSKRDVLASLLGHPHAMRCIALSLHAQCDALQKLMRNKMLHAQVTKKIRKTRRKLQSAAAVDGTIGCAGCDLGTARAMPDNQAARALEIPRRRAVNASAHHHSVAML